MTDPASNLEEIEEFAAQWILRAEQENWTQEDQAELTRWLEASLANKAAYWRLEHVWKQSDRLAALGPQINVDNSLSAEDQPIGRSFRYSAIAAALVAIVAVGFMIQYVSQPASMDLTEQGTDPELPTQVKIDVEGGRNQSIDLADGTSIEIVGGSALRSAISDDKREIWLDDGEATFDVKTIAGQPFVVNAADHVITVLGTKFVVRNAEGNVSIDVIEGRVQVQRFESGQLVSSRILTPTLPVNTPTLIAPQSVEVAQKIDSPVADSAVEEITMLRFDDAPLTEVAQALNLHNSRQLYIADDGAAAVRIGGSFEATNLDAFVRLLDDAYGLTVVEEGEMIRISE